MTPEPIEITSRGITLRGQRWPGDAVTVLLLHEPGEEHDLDRWRPLIPYLLGNGATVLAFDLRGHGASDGDWDPHCAVEDVAAVVAEARVQASVVVCAAGESAIAALRAAELAPIDGLILLSPAPVYGQPPRGSGVPKLLIAGAHDASRRDTVAHLRAASIGPVLSVLVPTSAQGTDLIAGDIAATCREHILTFLNERRLEARQHVVGTRPEPDQFLERLGIRPKGVDE
jgi:pimeloyl-ACP methyl ester carboxylesterase